MNKPTVFNYRRYKELKEAYRLLLDENKELKHDMANLEIRCRIAEAMVKELKGESNEHTSAELQR